MDYLINITLYILQGAEVSLKVFFVTTIFSIPLGIISAIGKIVGIKPIKWLLEIYTWLLRGTPLMLQLFFVYYGLYYIAGIRLESIMAAYLAFTVNYAAYFTEIFRAGIQSIDKGQYEASKALGMTYRQTMIRIVIPQAIKRVLPPAGSEIINLIKDTALVFVISIGDIMRNSQEVASRDAKMDSFIIAAVIYLILTYFIVFIFNKFEKKLSYYD